MSEGESCSVAFVDLDGTFLERKRRFPESVFESITSPFLGRDNVSALTLIYDIFTSYEPDFHVKQEVLNFLDSQDFDREFILTGRLFTGFGSNTRRLKDRHLGRFDDVLMYPGINVYGERVLGRRANLLRYLLGIGILDYKESVVDMFSDFERVAVIDNSRAVVERMEGKEAVDDVYFVDGEGINRF